MPKALPRRGVVGPALRSLLMGCLCTAGTTRTAAAQTDTTQVTTLAPITVTGSRAQAVAPPVSTVSVAPADLRRAPAATAYDLVRRTSGIEVHEQGQGPGFASDAVIRGFTSDHSSDVLLVVDGVPINLPIHGHVEGYADWSILSPAGVSSLRVIHGPASPLYGDFAFGGVVEVATAPDAAGTAGALGGSSQGDVGGWVRTGHRSNQAGMLFALDGRRQDGWRDNSDYWLGNLLLRGWRQAGVARLEGGLAVYGSRWNSPGFVPVARYNAGDLQSATDPTDGGSAERVVMQGHYRRPLNPSTTLELSAWGQRVRSSVFLNIPEDGEEEQSEENDRRWATGGQAQVTWNTSSGELTGGVSARGDWASYDLYATESRRRTGSTQADDGRYRAISGFVRWRGLLWQRVAYDLGGRIDGLRYSRLDRLDPGPGYEGDTHVLLGPKLGARYILGGGTSLLASVSRGFRGAVGVIGDPTRQPVTAWAKEIGASYQNDRVQVQVALFRIDVAHERIQDPVTRDVSDAGQSVRQGASVDASVAVAHSLRLVAEGTFNDAKITGVAEAAGRVVVPNLLVQAAVPRPEPSFHDVPLSPGDRVPGVSRYFGRAGIEADLHPGLAAQALVRFTGPVTPIGEPGVRTQAYAVLDLGASFRVAPHGGTVDLDLLNAFDTRYPELRASGFINPGAPRSLRVGLRFDDRP